MGLLSALNTTISALNINQQNLNVLSQNIANANTQGYSNETANQQATFIAGQGTGVEISSITRNIDAYTNSEVTAQTSASNYDTSINDYYSQIQNLLGSPGSNNSVDQSITNFFTEVQSLANNSGSAANTNVVNAATTLATQISGLASSLQNLRLNADSDIGSAVQSVNADLQTLSKLNNALEQANNTNQNTAGLLDQRDAAINDLAQYVDIKPIYQPDGSTTINTTNGTTLLTGTTTSSLSYSAANSVNTFTNGTPLAPITVTTLDANGNQLGNPVTLITGGQSQDVTSVLKSGKLLALQQTRDTVIPNLLSQLDQLSSQLRDNVNAINNAGTSFPPPGSYTGQNLVTGSTTSEYSGSIRIAVLGQNGSPVSSPYPDETNGLQPVTLNLATLDTANGTATHSVDGLIDAINHYFAPPQNKTEIGNLNNVQLGVVSNTVPDTGSTVKLDFNLNNISNNSAAFYAGGVTVTDSSGNVVSSSAAGTVTTTQPSFALSSTGTYTTTIGSNTVTVSAAGATGLKDGDVVYLNPPASPVTSVNGIPSASLGGYFKVSNVVGNQFDITVAGASSSVNASSAANVSGVTATTQYATAAAGQTLTTQGNGVITASLAANSTSPYYTVTANIATLDSSGNLKQSTVSYRITNNAINTANTLVGATTANGDATIVQPTTTQPLVTASLVDANGNPLPEVNGSYGNQAGYLKISATNASNSIAIDEMDSKQLGLPSTLGTLNGTNQGFSQYFGLNNFFNNNTTASTTDNVTNSAINLSVASRIVNNPSLVSTASLVQGNQPANTTLPPNLTYTVQSGDNSNSQKLAALSTGLISFSTTPGLSATTTTLSQYAGQIIATNSANASVANSNQTNSSTLLQGYQTAAQKVSGVNLDQELANTVIYQNAYSASARIVTVISQLFTTLIQSV